MFDEDDNLLSGKDVQNLGRKKREFNSREAEGAKHVKQTNSKAFHCVHRKERERAELAEGACKVEIGKLDSEEERELQDPTRATGRVGQRHKENKWAEIGAKTKLAVGDEDFRAGLTVTAWKDQELRHRIEGRTGGSDEGHYIAQALECDAYYSKVGSPAEKKAILSRWLDAPQSVIVANSALGLALDVPDVPPRDTRWPPA
ncbi:hypothetical protein S40288_09916 [Stachybotrys chartarum IBT 40288]|nr:hypothetical protein S40288_09916 [Stachybotrys chartarum IBT 40288]